MAPQPQDQLPPDLREAQRLGVDYVLWKPGVWSFKCPAPNCHFDSVDLAMLKKHIVKHAPPKQPANPSLIQYVDKYGNPQPGPPGSGNSKE